MKLYNSSPIWYKFWNPNSGFFGGAILSGLALGLSLQIDTIVPILLVLAYAAIASVINRLK